MKLKLLKITPVMSVAGLYASGDQVGLINTASKVFDSSGGQVLLRSVSVLDGDKESKALDLLFFDSNPTLTSIDNDAAAFTDAELLSKCIGKVSIGSTDYVTTANSSVATKDGLTTVLQAKAGSQDLYVLIVTRSTPTYVSGSLKILLGLEAS